MKVKHVTPRVESPWISIADVGRRLGCSRQTAWRRLMSGAIPGLERWYAWDDGRTHWHVDRAKFGIWNAARSGRFEAAGPIEEGT